MRKLCDITKTKTVTAMQTDRNGVAHEVTRQIKKHLVVKTTGQGLRLVHLIVDTYGIMFLSAFILPEELAVFYFAYPLINIILESTLGQTLGKLITQSVVIDEYAEKPNFGVCFLRGIIRFVPFEAFSNLNTPSRGWHDRWSNTYVVPKKDLEKLKELVNEDDSLIEEFGKKEE